MRLEAKIRGQTAEDRGQKEIRSQPPSPHGFGAPRRAEDRRQRKEDGGQPFDRLPATARGTSRVGGKGKIIADCGNDETE